MIEANMRTEPVAIVGMGCRFPGAEGLEAFWQLLRDGVDAISEIPADRFDIDTWYDPRPGIPGKINTRWGGFLERIDQFDPYFFRISAREAAAMDPQQRLLLEVAWEAMEDAGLVPEELDVGRTGVFMGMCNSDYKDLIEDPTDIDIYVGGGLAWSILSGRISYVLGLQGPSITIDTACSSSLVAVHLACRSLWTGESTLALAGGVNLILSPAPYMSFSQAGMLASDGRCKFGDARADGFIRSEGAGVIALKPLSLALANGDPIYAVIRGSAVNNDGNSGGLLMAPSRAGQEAVFKEAYRSASLSSGEVQYVEVHGTGTSVGDPIEMQAIGTVLAEGRSQDRPCIIGSAKTNIGHTEGAAGIAGLIKTALSLKHRTIPPSLHFRDPNPNIPWQDLPLVVQREQGPWPEASGPARAGVSSFGISGTNAHVVLEEAPEISLVQEEAQEAATDYLLPLSTHSPESLKALVRAYQKFLVAEDGEVPSLHDVCYTASLRRTQHDHRLALVGRSREELAEHLEAFLQGESRQGMSSGRKIAEHQRKLVFVFPGQGSQWIDMGRELLEQEPVFREALECCERGMRKYVDWSLLEELTTDEARSRLNEVSVIQPTIFAIQVALVALWRSWGIEPDAVVGQSMGEVAAAHVAGALSLDDAARVICRRSQLVKTTSRQGGMAVVQLSLEKARHILAGYEDRVSAAASTSPSSTVFSGETAALKEILDELECQDVFCRWVKVDYAAHSPQMDPLCPHLLRILEGVQPRPSFVPIYSTVTGEIRDGQAFDADYWVQNLRQPVLFSTAVQRLSEEGHDIFLEISPHPTLLNAIEQGLHHLGREGATLPSLRQREERAVMLGSFGALYTLGYPVDWNKLYPSGGRVVRLPSYPWQRERFWLGSQENDDGRRNGGRAVAHRNRRGHLLGEHLGSAADSGAHFWEMDLSINLFRYLNDHRVQGLAVLPAAAYAEMALAAATETFGPGLHVLEEVTFKKALFLPEDGIRIVQLVFFTQMIGEISFQFFSRQASTQQQGEALWVLHAAGKIRLSQADPAESARKHESPEEIQARCQEAMSSKDFYNSMGKRGIQYGPSFQGVEEIWRRNGEAVGRVCLPEALASEAGTYQVHPTLLDACFQVLAGTHFSKDEEDACLYLPVGLGQMRLYERPGTELWSHVLLRSDAPADDDTLEADMFLLSESGQVVLEVLGLRCQRVEHDAQGDTQQNLNDWLYETQWQLQACSQEDQTLDLFPPDQRGSWLIFADSSGIGQALQGLLQARGEICVMVSPGDTYRRTDSECYQINAASLEDIQQLLADILGPDRPSYRGVIHLWSLEAVPSKETTLASLKEAQVLGCINVLHLVQALTEVSPGVSPRLWLVTRGSQPAGDVIEPVSVGQAPLWAMGKVISFEHPEFRCTKVDLSPSDEPEEIESLFRELWAEDKEDQIALRGDARYVPRIARSLPTAREEKKQLVSPDEPFRLDIVTPGILDSLVLRKSTRREPGPKEVEIQIRAVGLNFRDVLMAMDLVPPVFESLSIDVGFECVGKITAVGEGVEGLQVGDEVIAGAPACFSSYTTTNASLVTPKPVHLSFEEAATILIAFLTAYYSLHHVGRIREGERILIHAAAGGVGLAAVQLAQQAGVEIFATAGTPEKREFLRSLGIQYVMDSRTLEFADEVMEYTGGEGVDIVLNSLAGDFIPKSVSTLRSGGRFLEIGKIDILRNTQLGLQLLENNISFSTIDLGRLLVEQPNFCMSVLREVTQLLEDGFLKPLPLKVFPISQLVEAFRYLAQARHIGKIVVSLREDEVPVAPSKEPIAVRSDGTYLITGGFGGLGLATAQWLVWQGARHLVLVGRSGASTVAKEAIENMEAAGAQIVVAKADVSQESQVVSVLAKIRQSMPPLRGVFHTAGVLDDGLLLQLNEERFRSVMTPKVDGGWNLHRLTLDEELDCFVLFSSVASVFGSPGQGNYVAANAFLDALAHHRHALGLPALATNWGAWGEVGMVTRSARVRKNLTQGGIISFTPEQGVQLMAEMLRRDPIQAMGAHIDWDKLLDAIGAHLPPLFSSLAEELIKESSGSRKDLTREKLLAAGPKDRRQLMQGFLVEQIARVLKCSPSKVDTHQPLNRLGIDSLMAVELKNRVEADLELAVPVTALLQGPTLSQLATHLLKQLTPTPASTPSASIAASGEAAEQLPVAVDQLSDEEVDSLLHSLLKEERDK